MTRERLAHHRRQHRHPVRPAFAIPHDDLLRTEIHGLHPQVETLAHAQPRTVEQRPDQPLDTVKLLQQRTHLVTREHDGQPPGALRPHESVADSFPPYARYSAASGSPPAPGPAASASQTHPAATGDFQGTCPMPAANNVPIEPGQSPVGCKGELKQNSRSLTPPHVAVPHTPRLERTPSCRWLSRNVPRAPGSASDWLPSSPAREEGTGSRNSTPKGEVTSRRPRRDYSNVSAGSGTCSRSRRAIDVSTARAKAAAGMRSRNAERSASA